MFLLRLATFSAVVKIPKNEVLSARNCSYSQSIEAITNNQIVGDTQMLALALLLEMYDQLPTHTPREHVRI